MPPPVILEPRDFPTAVLVDLEGIRRLNPQRYEMEQLSAITLLDQERSLIVGYKDLAPDEFWVRGHMPGFPLMPGVLMCEAAAQLCSYFCTAVGLLEAGEVIGFGGMEAVRFRGSVFPGNRLWLVGQAGSRLNRRRMEFNLQGFVNEALVFHGIVLGVAIKPNPPGPTNA